MLVKLSFPCVLFCIALVNINCICSGPTVVRPCVVICCNVVCCVNQFFQLANGTMEDGRSTEEAKWPKSLFSFANSTRVALCSCSFWTMFRTTGGMPFVTVNRPSTCSSNSGPNMAKREIEFGILTCKNPYVSLRGFQCFVHCWIVMRVSPYIVVVEEPMSSMSASLSASLISLRHVLSKNYCPEFNSQK